MPYKKMITGGSYGPGGSFPDRCYFENCTFVAGVSFGKHCDFVNCTFVKCCPKPNNNLHQIKEHARFFNCKLESVQVQPHAELYNTNNSGYLVTIMQPLPIRNQTEKRGGEQEIKSDSGCGQRIDSTEMKIGKDFVPCPDENIQGYSDTKAKTKNCKCPENVK